MQGKVTLKDIIESVLSDIDTDNFTLQEYNQYENDKEKNTRSLYRKFERLLERLGSNKEVLKDGGRTMEFDELDAPIIKALISQLYSGQGIIAEFVNARNESRQFSSNDVIEFIHALCDEVEKDDTMNKEELAYLAQFFNNIFLYSPLRSIETCHKTIDALALRLHDLTYDEQSIYLGKVEHILRKEYALRVAESAREIIRIADSKECREHYYYECDPEIKFYYIQRDRQILKAIQEDDDLRQYIEKKLRQKAEMIFNYASLE